jgi:dTDP-4-amino-4,6-dideoxygalactose transaminase
VTENKLYFGLSDIWALAKGTVRNEISLFEKEFAEYIGVKHAVGTSYGRTALYAGLKALDLKNKEVILPVFTCTVVRNAVEEAGAIIRFVDIDPSDFNFRLDDLKRKISDKTKAIVLTHYFGRAATNLEAVMDIAKKGGICLIEDCAHSLGAQYKGKKLGTFGDFSIFSLTKNMVNFGGGVFTTNSETLFKTVKESLQNGKISLKRKTLNYILIIAYGLEQMINKLIYDRIKRSIFKWWILSIPNSIRSSKRFLMRVKKKAFSRQKRSSLNENKKNLPHGERDFNAFEHMMTMAPIIASLGRSQLKKIDVLNNTRRTVQKGLTNIKQNHFDGSTRPEAIDAGTHLLLRFPDRNIFNIIEEMKRKNVLLRPTWPTHQKLRKEQQVESVEFLKTQILTWDVSPNVKINEIDEFIRLLKAYN